MLTNHTREVSEVDEVLATTSKHLKCLDHREFCMFCRDGTGYPIGDFFKHVSRHMQSVSHVAIPPSSDVDSGDSDDDVSVAESGTETEEAQVSAKRPRRYSDYDPGQAEISSMALLSRTNEMTEDLGKYHVDILRLKHSAALRLREADLSSMAYLTIRDVTEAGRSHHGVEHPIILDAMYVLGVWLGEDGECEEALRVTEEVVNVRRGTLGEGHPLTLNAMASLSMRLYDVGRRAEAMALMLDVQKDRETFLGKDHLDTIASLLDVNQYAEDPKSLRDAITAITHVVEKRKEILGDEHPETLSAMFALVLKYEQDPKQLDRARHLVRRVIQGRRRVLGSESVYTLVAQAKLAYLLDPAYIDEAIDLLSPAISLTTRSREPFDIAHAKWVLAHWLNRRRPAAATNVFSTLYSDEYKKGNGDSPRAMYCKYESAMNALLTPRDHPQYEANKEWAIIDLRLIVEERQEAVGKAHPTTLLAMQSLATAYYGETGRCQDALEMMEEVVSIWKQLDEQAEGTKAAVAQLNAWYAELAREADPNDDAPQGDKGSSVQ